MVAFAAAAALPARPARRAGPLRPQRSALPAHRSGNRAPAQLARRARCCATPAAPLGSDAEVRALRGAQRADLPLPGTVYLVGAGPGDGGLLTVAARALLRRADVILYDRLAAGAALAHAGAGATTLHVGKTAGLHTRTQGEIHALLAAFAGAHETVVRLKGGDPCVFGRGGEEAAYLRALGVRVRIVPGVTAASGIAAGLGFPLTHRGLADSVRFATGHLQDGRNPDIGPVGALTTLVLYMGLAQLPHILPALAAQGLAPDTPAVAVERGTTPDERVVWGTVADLARKVAADGLRSPTLVVVGRVVALAQGWVDEMQPGQKRGAGRARVADLVGRLRPEDRALLAQSARKQELA